MKKSRKAPARKRPIKRAQKAPGKSSASLVERINAEIALMTSPKVARAVREKLSGAVALFREAVAALSASLTTSQLFPNGLKLGVYYPDYGGEFHGLVRGEKGEPDYALFSAVKTQHEATDFDSLQSWAKGLKLHGYGDYSMPNRRDLRVQMANAAEGSFEKTWYWSNEQYAIGSDYAWCQDFGYGNQYYWSKGGQFRGCAVRRVPIR